MASNLNLTTGSVFAGNPITFQVMPEVLTNPTFHRVMVDVTCALNSDTAYNTIQFSVPVVTEGEAVEFDVSSALRVPLDAYEYSAAMDNDDYDKEGDTKKFPWVKWQISCCDEYMDSQGALHTEVNRVYFPGEETYYRAIAGGFTDMERLYPGGETRGVQSLTRKPTSTPQLAAVGEQLTYAVAYAEEQKIAESGALEQPASKTTSITAEGAQEVGGVSVYALPAASAALRTEFRFINSRGVMESISVPRAYKKSFSHGSTSYAKAVQETFNKFSRSSVQKTNNKEAWLFTTDPLNEDWLHWYLHEFLMSENVWIKVNGHWLYCVVTIDDSVDFYDKTGGQMFYLGFTATLDINGSPYM